MPEVDLSKKSYWYKDTVIKFGQYKGEDYTVAQIMKLDKGASYLIWLDDNVEWFNLDEDVRLECEELVEKERERKRNNRRGAGSARFVVLTEQRRQMLDDPNIGHADDDEIPF